MEPDGGSHKRVGPLKDKFILHSDTKEKLSSWRCFQAPNNVEDLEPAKTLGDAVSPAIEFVMMVRVYRRYVRYPSRRLLKVT